jgi:hypothetical protein
LHLKEEEERAAFKARRVWRGRGKSALITNNTFSEKLKLWKNKIPGQKPLSPLVHLHRFLKIRLISLCDFV